jgi:nitroreductase/dihydropteridine reductase
MDILKALEWRYATKKMNGTPVSQEKVNRILEAARLAPTSSGLQPFKVLVITDPELKAKIQPIAFGQSQVVDGSHVLVFAAWDSYTDARIDGIFDYMNTERGLPLNTTDDYKNSLKAQFATLTPEQQHAHAAKQAYIAFGTAIVAAAMEEVDATPMEGFNNAQLDELLGLEQLGLKSTTMLALGYRDTANDWLANLKKVRTAKEDFFMVK